MAAKPQYQADVLEPPDHYFARAANGNFIPARSSHPRITIDVKTQDDDAIRLPKPQRTQVRWKRPLVITTCCILVGMMFWQYSIVPAWTQYQDQLQCGAGHICSAAVEVSPGKKRLFVALIYDKRLLINEMPDDTYTDGTSFPGAMVVTNDWQTVTPHIEVMDVNHDGHPDIVIDSPEFQGVNPVLYNQGNGTFSWEAPERK